MTTPPGCLSDLDLDGHRLGTLAGDEAARVAGHLDGCDPCAARLAELEAAAATFAAEFDVAALVDDVAARAARPQRAAATSRWWPAVAVAAAAGLLLVVLPSTPEPPSVDGTAAGDRVKGGAGLLVYVARPGGPELANPGDRFAAGDRLMFRLNPGGHRFGLLVGVEADGDVSVYLPAGGRRSAPLTTGVWTESPRSIVLDASPGAERLIALYSDAPLRVEDVEKAVAGAGPGAGALAVPGAGAQATFVLNKP